MNRRFLRLVTFCVLSLVSLAGTLHAAGERGTIIPRTTAARFGLTRAWFTQVEVDSSRSRVSDVVLQGDGLFVQTTHGTLHALDAETGAARWVMQIGRAGHPSTRPAANDQFVAVLNGSRLYVLNRSDGRRQWDRALRGGPGAGPVVTKTRVLVPMANGQIEAYELERGDQPPWIYSSAGRAMVPALVTPRSVCWTTDRGHLYVGRADEPAVRFRLETYDEIEASPTYLWPYVYAASRDGYVYAAHELKGTVRWRFSAGEPIGESPVAIEGRVYVCPDGIGLVCLEAETGVQIWATPGVARFLAASEERIYATDNLGRLLILDAPTGARIASLHLPDMSMMLVNRQNDRIYVGDDQRLIVCLHETGRDEPLVHKVIPDDVNLLEEDSLPKPGATKRPAEQPFKAPDGGDGDVNPFADRPDDNPFDSGNKGGGVNPFETREDKTSDDNPFAPKDDDNPFD